MAVDDFQNALEALQERFADGNEKPTSEERNLAKATVESWFRNYRPQIIDLFGELDEVGALDILMQDVHTASLGQKKKIAYKPKINSALKIFRDELLTNIKIAEWRQIATSGFPDENKELMTRLRKLDADLELSYRQVLTDLADQNRLTYRGTANELREIFREILDKLAPDNEIISEDWFKQKRLALSEEKEKKRQPTRSEKVKFILMKLNRDSSALEVSEKAASQIDERLGGLVNAIYGRASDASHVQKQRDEINRILKYFHAVLFELLPS